MRKRTKTAKAAGSRRPRAERAAAALDSGQYRALAEFRYALRAFLAFSEAATRASGVTPQQYQALLSIKSRPDEAVLVRDLAEQLFLKHNNAVQLADRLVQAGLVRREPSKRDRRAVVLHLTRKGEEKVAWLAAIHFRELVRRQSQLTDASRLARRLSQA